MDSLTLDNSLSNLQSNKNRWATLPITDKIDYLIRDSYHIGLQSNFDFKYASNKQELFIYPFGVFVKEGCLRNLLFDYLWKFFNSYSLLFTAVSVS